MNEWKRKPMFGQDTGYTLKADANTDTDGKHRRATVGDNRRVES